jgi:sulfur-carrier protein adenylyltransferase/sulfurtransferase
VNPWFLSDPTRVSLERTAVEQLQQSEEWLLGSEWLLCEVGLCLDAVIRAHDHDYEVRMEYPTLFPNVQPIVRPRNAKELWSGHQYLSGTLCLEWGPDNWHPEVTGAQVLASTYNLLNLENPLGEGEFELSVPVPSRHALTTGQKLRGSYGRFYVGEATLEYLAQRPSTCGVFKFSTHWRAERWLEVIHEVRSVGDESSWVDPMIPKFLCGKNDGTTYNGVFFKTDLDPVSLNGTVGVENLATLLRQAGHLTEVITNGDISNFTNLGGPPAGVLILDRNNEPHCLLLFPENKTLTLAVVRSESPPVGVRSPANLKGLGEKSVGLVGLGSAGSKIAMSLARMGVRRFHLVDHDIFLPENVERHALDWASVGEHKVDGEMGALLRLGVEFKVEVSRTHLTGQESTALVSGVLSKLGQCDLLIDATADQRVFNLMSAVAAAYEKPLVWLLTYGGGLGGMIARSRPERDPDPQTMRAVYLNYCAEHPAPESMQIAADYATEVADVGIISASDADVAIIAHHAARFAVDTLSDSDSSAYPYSMYLVGLAPGWVFDAPFTTIPLATDHFVVREKKADHPDQEAIVDGDRFIVSLVEKLRATPTST